MKTLNLEKILGGIELISSTRLGLLSELYMLSVYKQLIDSVVREACVTLQNPGSSWFEEADRYYYAGKVFIEHHEAWWGERDDHDGEVFFRVLASMTAWDIRGGWSRENYRCFASQGLIENNGFMTYLAPMQEVFNRLVDEDTLVGVIRAKYPQGSPWSEPRFWQLEGDTP